MDRDQVKTIYDREYAEAYDARFLLAEWPEHGLNYELSVIGPFLDGEARWLDLGCGTGHVLSRFPGVARAGLDISPDMIAIARQANPDAEFLREGDFLEDVPEWRGSWSLITCMWTAYNYVESIHDVERLIENVVRWTAPGGTVFIPVMDLEDLRPHTIIAYEEFPDVWFGRLAITGYTWTWEEPDGRTHEHLVAPHIGHFVRLLEPHFAKIDVVRYPPFEQGGVSRKAVLATGRRAPGETGTAEVVWHEPPPHPEDVAPTEDAAPTEPEGGRAAAEDTSRPAQPAGPRSDELAGRPGSPGSPAPARLSSVSSGRLAGELAGRFRPWSPGFWRGVRRNASRLVRRAGRRQPTE